MCASTRLTSVRRVLSFFWLLPSAQNAPGLRVLKIYVAQVANLLSVTLDLLHLRGIVATRYSAKNTLGLLPCHFWRPRRAVPTNSVEALPILGCPVVHNLAYRLRSLTTDAKAGYLRIPNRGARLNLRNLAKANARFGAHLFPLRASK